jgi:hypothetical protein
MKQKPNIPHLQQRAFQLPQKIVVDVPKDYQFTAKTEEHFLAEIESFIRCPQLKSCFQEEYQRHLYAADNELNHQLRKGMAFISLCWFKEGDNSLSQSAKQMIVSKLTEEITKCGKGFYNRTLEIIHFLENNFTLTQVLMVERKSLVNRASVLAENGNDTHNNNRFHLIARLEGFGVEANENDYNHDVLGDQAIKEIIYKVMIEHYHPLTLYKLLSNQIKNKLHNNYKYIGSLQDAVYIHPVYLKWCDVLNGFFEGAVQYHNNELLWFEWDENDTPVVTDINWPLVNYKIFCQLKKQIFDIPQTVAKTLDRLFNPDDKEPSESAIDNLFNADHAKTAFITCHHHFFALLAMTPDKKQITLWQPYKYYLEKNHQLTILFWQRVLAYFSIAELPDAIASDISDLSTKDILTICAQDHVRLYSILECMAKTFKHSETMICVLIPFLNHLPDKIKQFKALGYFYHKPIVQSNKILSHNLQAWFEQDRETFETLIYETAIESPPSLAQFSQTLDLLSDQTIYNLVTTQQHGGLNYLIWLVRENNLHVFQLLLTQLCRFKSDIQFKILSYSIAYSRYTLLTEAIEKSPEATQLLLKYFRKNLNDVHKAALLKQCSLHGVNALMYALAKADDDTVSAVIAEIETLTEEHQFLILKQSTVFYGYNAFLIAAEHNPTMLPRLLNFLKRFDFQKQLVLLKQQKKSTMQNITAYLDNIDQNTAFILKGWIALLDNKAGLNSRQEVMAALKVNGALFQFADQALKVDLHVAMTAVINYPPAIHYVEGELKNNRYLKEIANISTLEQRREKSRKYFDSDDFKKAALISNYEKYILMRRRTNGGKGIFYDSKYLLSFFSPQKLFPGEVKIKAAEKMIEELKGNRQTFLSYEKEALCEGNIQKAYTICTELKDLALKIFSEIDIKEVSDIPLHPLAVNVF